MASYAGLMTGAIVIIMIISYLLFRFVFEKWNAGIPGIAVTCGITAVISIILTGYGNANGGPPRFDEAIFVYVPAAIIVFGIMAFNLRRKGKM